MSCLVRCRIRSWAAEFVSKVRYRTLAAKATTFPFLKSHLSSFCNYIFVKSLNMDQPSFFFLLSNTHSFFFSWVLVVPPPPPSLTCNDLLVIFTGLQFIHFCYVLQVWVSLFVYWYLSDNKFAEYYVNKNTEHLCKYSFILNQSQASVSNNLRLTTYQIETLVIFDSFSLTELWKWYLIIFTLFSRVLCNFTPRLVGWLVGQSVS